MSQSSSLIRVLVHGTLTFLDGANLRCYAWPRSMIGNEKKTCSLLAKTRITLASKLMIVPLRSYYVARAVSAKSDLQQDAVLYYNAQYIIGTRGTSQGSYMYIPSREPARIPYAHMCTRKVGGRTVSRAIRFRVHEQMKRALHCSRGMARGRNRQKRANPPRP